MDDALFEISSLYSLFVVRFMYLVTSSCQESSLPSIVYCLHSLLMALPRQITNAKMEVIAKAFEDRW